MTNRVSFATGIRVRDAVGAMFGSDSRGTVRRLSGDTHAWIRWDDEDGPLDLVAADDWDVIAWNQQSRCDRSDRVRRAFSQEGSR